MNHKKGRNNQSRFSSSTSHLAPPRKITYRTVFKHRNQSMSTSQLYENTPILKSKVHSKTMSQSQITVNPQSTGCKQETADIKQFVKKMVCPQEQKSKPRQIRSSEYGGSKLIKSSAKSILTVPFNFIQPIQSEPRGNLSIEELQKRIEMLISDSFQGFRRQKSHIGLAKWSQIRCQMSVEKQLDEIIQKINQLNLQYQTKPENLQSLNKKIEMLQKMIASQNTEADILKSQYFGWKNQRNNTTSFINKKKTGQIKVLNGDKFINRNKQNISIDKKSKQSVVKYASTSKLNYKKPAKEYYLLSKHSHQSYSVNRQPFPRSSYSAQYLNYGTIPTYSCKPQEFKDLPQSSLAVKASIYQQEYKDQLGLIKSINFKDLDCCQDKFKNTKISFMNSSKKYANRAPVVTLKKKEQDKTMKENKQQELAKDKKSRYQSTFNLMSLSTCGDFYKSQNKKQFIWHNNMNTEQSEVNEDMIQSKIKDKQLSKLKAAFKAMAMRS